MKNIKHKIIEYIYSGHTGIYLQTTEHERIDLILRNISKELDSTIIEWNLGYGIVDFDHKKPLTDINDMKNITLSQYLPSLYDLDDQLGRKIILIKNIDDIISDDRLSETRLNHLISRLKELDTQKSCVIMIGSSGKISPILSSQAVLIQETLPDKDYIKEIIITFAEKKEIVIDQDLISKLVAISLGLKTEQIKQSLTLAFNQFKGIDEQALNLMIKEKNKLIPTTNIVDQK